MAQAPALGCQKPVWSSARRAWSGSVIGSVIESVYLCAVAAFRSRTPMVRRRTRLPLARIMRGASSAGQPAAELVELFEGGVFDPQFPRAIAVDDVDAHAQRILQVDFQRGGVGVLAGAARAGRLLGRPAVLALGQGLGVADGKPFLDNGLRQDLGEGGAEDRARVARG